MSTSSIQGPDLVPEETEEAQRLEPAENLQDFSSRITPLNTILYKKKADGPFNGTSAFLISTIKYQVYGSRSISPFEDPDGRRTSFLSYRVVFMHFV
jgi:hypothetical protein